MITKVDIAEIPGRRVNYNNAVSQEVTQFYESDWAACEVNVGKYKNAHSATAAYREAIKRLKANVIAIERGNRLFLVRGEN